MTNRMTEEIREQTMRNLFDRLSCLQATSDFHCGEGLEWKNGRLSIKIHGFVTSVGMAVLNKEVEGQMWYDDTHNLGLMVY